MLYRDKEGGRVLAQQWTATNTTLKETHAAVVHEGEDFGVIFSHNPDKQKAEYPVVRRGDWVIFSGRGQVMPMSDETFKNIYKPASERQPTHPVSYWM